MECEEGFAGLPVAAKAQLVFGNESVKCGCRENEEPLCVEFMELVHEGDCAVFVKSGGLFVFGDHYCESVVPVFGSCRVVVVSGSGELCEKSG